MRALQRRLATLERHLVVHRPPTLTITICVLGCPSYRGEDVHDPACQHLSITPCSDPLPPAAPLAAGAHHANQIQTKGGTL